MTAMTVDQIKAHNLSVAQLAQAKGAALTIEQLLQTKEVQALITKAEIRSAEEASAFFLHMMLDSIATLFKGNPLSAGAALDNALTSYFADLRVHLGEETSKSCAGILIRNVALFLDAGQRDAVLGVFK